MTSKDGKTINSGPFGKFDPDNPAHQKWLRDLSETYGENPDVTPIAKKLHETYGIGQGDFVLDGESEAMLEKILKRGKP